MKQEFDISQSDQEFYDRIGVPAPTLPPQERQRRRLAFRNEMFLYQRKCDKTGDNIIAMYPADAPFPVYEAKAWYGDDWDPLEYGQDFDFDRPFFEQFAELQKKVPRMALISIDNENADFTSYALKNKDCYLIYTADFNERCYYGRFSDRNYNCVDFDFTADGTQCYEVTDTVNCNRVFFSQLCENSHELLFCYNVKGSNNCLFSANLRNKEYYVFNKKVSKEDYKKIVDELNLGSYKSLQEAKKKFQEFLKDQPRRATQVINSENSTGNYLRNCSNAQYCYDSYELENVKFATHLQSSKDSYDWDFVGAKSELCYEVVSSAHQLNDCKFMMNSWNSVARVLYSDLILGASDLFGCIGLRKKKFCVLNKQYSEEEYNELLPKIIEHMKGTNEWGEFFPITLSPYGYNETVAQEDYPLTKEETIAKGYHWKDDDPKEYQPQTYEIPDNIQEVTEDILKQLLACEVTGKNYRITKQELEFYQENNLPIPHKSPEQRHKDRRELRNPRQLYERDCAKCSKPTQTTYESSRPEPIYCESCYLAEIL